MMVAKSFYNAAHFAEIFQSLDNLRENEKTCDIHLITSNKKLYAHKIVLASVSEYFKNAIYGLFLNESDKNELELKEVKYEILSAILDYTYTGKIDIDSENVFDIFEAADYYLIKFLKEMCLEFLQENLDTDNCIRIWLMANSCKREQLIMAARNFIFSNLEIVSNSEKFLSLSDEELLDLFKFWPKQELSDAIIISVLRWAEDKDNVEETLINILKDIPHTSISEDYLENCLSGNEFIQTRIGCKWISNIFKEKTEFHKWKQAESEAKLKFNSFIYDQPIFFMSMSVSKHMHFYKYNCRNGAFNLYSKIGHWSDLCDCKIYKNLMYILRPSKSDRFTFDGLPENRFESSFNHNHGSGVSSAIFNDTMYIFGGKDSKNIGSIIDLNTEQSTSFNLLNDREFAGVVEIDGIIYICAGLDTNTVERFDPREGRTTNLGIIFEETRRMVCSAAALSNKIYCHNRYDYKTLDPRNSNIWTQIEPPRKIGFGTSLVSSYGKMYTTHGITIYKYNNAFQKWQKLEAFKELPFTLRATSLE